MNFKEMTLDKRIEYFEKRIKEVDELNVRALNANNQLNVDYKMCWGVDLGNKPSILDMIKLMREVKNAPETNIIT